MISYKEFEMVSCQFGFSCMQAVMYFSVLTRPWKHSKDTPSKLTAPPMVLTHVSLNECREEIAYLMDCADTNRDGLLDYMEFTERFHQPAENIGSLVIICELTNS